MHATILQIQIANDEHGQATAGVRYRWACSCGETGKRWHASKPDGSGASAARSARRGGARHVAAMSRRDFPSARLVPATEDK